MGSIPGLGRSPEGGHGNPLQYSCLENPHGQRSLVGYSPQSCKELDMSEAIQHTCTQTFKSYHNICNPVVTLSYVDSQRKTKRPQHSAQLRSPAPRAGSQQGCSGGKGTQEGGLFLGRSSPQRNHWRQVWPKEQASGNSQTLQASVSDL